MFEGQISIWPIGDLGYQDNCYPKTVGEQTDSVALKPYIGILGDRTEVVTDVEQVRLVLGMKGDLTSDGY